MSELYGSMPMGRCLKLGNIIEIGFKIVWCAKAALRTIAGICSFRISLWCPLVRKGGVCLVRKGGVTPYRDRVSYFAGV